MQAPRAERFGSGRRLVIADDDPLQLKLALFRLGRLGFEIETARDGAERSRRCASGAPTRSSPT